MVTSALAVRNNDLGLMQLGEILAQSGFFQDSRGAAQAVVKVLAGQELGFGPIASMTGINVIKGRVAISGNLMAAAIKRSGRYNFKIKQLDGSGCTLEFFEGGQPVGVSSFTDNDAKAAGLFNNENYKKFPRNMYFNRALSNGAKWFCADIFGGPIYTPEELGATIDGETGEVIDTQPVIQPTDHFKPAEPTPQPEPAKPNGKPLDIAAHNRALLTGRIRSIAADLEQVDDPVTLDEHFLAIASFEELTALGRELAARLDRARASIMATVDNDGPEQE